MLVRKNILQRKIKSHVKFIE